MARIARRIEPDSGRAGRTGTESTRSIRTYAGRIGFRAEARRAIAKAVPSLGMRVAVDRLQFTQSVVRNAGRGLRETQDALRRIRARPLPAPSVAAVIASTRGRGARAVGASIDVNGTGRTFSRTAGGGTRRGTSQQSSSGSAGRPARVILLSLMPAVTKRIPISPPLRVREGDSTRQKGYPRHHGNPQGTMNHCGSPLKAGEKKPPLPLRNV